MKIDKKRLIGGLWVLSGWFLLYIAITGLLGFTIWRPYQNTPSCLPFVSIFLALVSSCPNEAVNIFWSLTVGWTRFLLILPALCIYIFLGPGGGPAIGYVACSILLLLILWAGTHYWWKRRRAVAVIATLMVPAEIMALGMLFAFD